MATTFLVACALALPALDCWFTGPDTFMLIRSSRIEGWQDVGRILSTPLASDGVDGLPFYRPVSTFSYALDYHLWGLDPRGFHTTNALLHAAAVTALCWFAYRLTGRLSVACLAAALFLLHPIAAERVYTIDERQDVLVSLLMLASMILFLEFLRAERARAGWYLSALACSALACFAKETAVLLPCLIGLMAWLLESPARPGGRERLKLAALSAAPFAAVLAVYVVVRTVVLRGAGGYGNSAAEWGHSLTVSSGDILLPVFANRLLVPNSRMLMSPMDVALGHYRRYEREELRALVTQAGFDVVDLFGFNRLGGLAWFIVNRILRRKNHTPGQMRWFDRLMPLVRVCEHVLPFKHVSLICIARKPGPLKEVVARHEAPAEIDLDS